MRLTTKKKYYEKFFALSLLFTLSFTSCLKGHVKKLEEMTDVPLAGKIVFKERVDRFDNWLGDGFFIETYDIVDNNLDIFEDMVTSLKFYPLGDKTDNALTISDDIKDSINEQEGYYKIYEKKGEIHIIVYNNVRRQIIYYCIFH